MHSYMHLKQQATDFHALEHALSCIQTCI